MQCANLSPTGSRLQWDARSSKLLMREAPQNSSFRVECFEVFKWSVFGQTHDTALLLQHWDLWEPPHSVLATAVLPFSGVVFLAPLTFRAAAGLGENLERKWRIKSEARKAEQRAWHKTGTPGNRWQH